MSPSFCVASPVWLELPVLESVLTPGGTPTSLSQAASSRSLACTHSSLSRDLAHQYLNLVVAQIFIDSLGEPYTATGLQTHTSMAEPTRY